MSGRTKIWLGIGAFALVQAGATLAGHGQLQPVPLAKAQTSHGQGGEGGEGGEAGAVRAGPLTDADYAVDLHLMLGHLLVGEELVALDAWNDALPHFAHPAEELYGPLAPELARRNAAPFADDLELLLRQVKARDKGPAFQKSLAEVRAKIAAALAVIDPATRGRPGFTAEVVSRLLRTAAGEYGQAFEDGKLVAVVEYQDSRGFVREAARLLDASEAGLRAADPNRLASLQGHLAELERAFPTPLPPAIPVMDPGQVSGLVSQIELDAGRFR